MHSTEQKPSALLAHIVSQTQSNIDFLVSQNYLRASDAAGILSKLADISASSATSGATNSPANDAQRDAEEVRNPVLSVAERMRHLNTSPSERENVPERASSPPKAVMVPTRRIVPAPPPRSQQAKAIWDYNADGSDPNDLSFRSGDIIEIISETNADWWTGRLTNGRQGLFPSNYVEKLPAPPSSPMRAASPGRAPVPVPGPSFPSAGPGGYRTHAPMWQASPQPYGYGNEKQHAVYAPPAPPPPQQYQPPPPPAPAPAPAPEPEKPSKFGGLGNTMATSAAGGLGFGAGAAVGSGIINSIF